MRTAAIVFTTALTLCVIAAPALAAESPCDAPDNVKAGLCVAERPLPQITTLSPRTPHAGSPVIMQVQSVGRGVEYAWDLDGDGEYDDATGSDVTHAFPAGRSTLSVRATDEFGRTGTETRTFEVHAVNAKPAVDLRNVLGRARVGQIALISVDGYDVDGQVKSIEVDGDGNGVYERKTIGDSMYAQLTYSTPGIKTVAARVTDDSGATAVATTTVRIVGSAPGVTVAARAGTVDHPIVAGEPVTLKTELTAIAAAKYEFDLDGNGTYETDNGASADATTTFTAGEHAFGVRVTGTGGEVAYGAGTAVAVADLAGVKPWLDLQLPGAMYSGDGVTLAAQAYPINASYTVAWDADDDGAFDDGTGTIAAGSGTTVMQFVDFTAAGDHTVRAKVTNGAGVSRIESRLLHVESWGKPTPPLLSMTGWSQAGAEQRLRAYVVETSPLTFDLDGDGDFNDIPVGGSGSFGWIFAGPTTIAAKATDLASGRSSVSTMEVNPLPGNLGPGVDFGPYRDNRAAGEPRLLADRVMKAEVKTRSAEDNCCTLVWDTDGDGAFDDAAPHTKPGAGERSLALRVTDDEGATGVTSKTFTVGTLPPDASFTATPTLLTSTATDPEGQSLRSIEWDLDGDREFGDATGATARPLPGAHEVGLKVTDASGDIGITYQVVTDEQPSTPLEPDPTTPQNPTGPENPTGPQNPATPPAPRNPAPLQLSVTAPKLAKLLSAGLRVGFPCSCRATVTITVDKATAKRLKLKSTQLGKATGRTGAFTVKLTTKARAALRRARSVKLKVTVTAAGHKAQTRTITVKR